MTTIYHMAAEADWHVAEANGHYGGSADDLRDGFIHFSTASQVQESAARHRAGRRDLVLLFVKAEILGPALKWEASRGGQPFPHLYSELPAGAVHRAVPLPLGPDGSHVFPALES